MLVMEYRGLRVWRRLSVVTLKFGTHFVACWVRRDVFSSESLNEHVPATNNHVDKFFQLYIEICCPFGVCCLVSELSNTDSPCGNTI